MPSEISNMRKKTSKKKNLRKYLISVRQLKKRCTLSKQVVYILFSWSVMDFLNVSYD